MDKLYTWLFGWQLQIRKKMDRKHISESTIDIQASAAKVWDDIALAKPAAPKPAAKKMLTLQAFPGVWQKAKAIPEQPFSTR